MREAEQLSQLIGDIYDAALDPSLWVAALGKVSAFVGGSAAALYSKDAIRKHGNVHYDDGGIDPRYRQLYFDKYVKLDPSTTGQYFSEVGELVAVADLLPYDEFLQTRFYNEWVRPQQLVDCLNAVLDKSQTSIAMLGVFRHARNGLVDNEARERMRLIVPHMRRAVLIGNVIDLKTAEASAFSDTLDGISAGMLLVNASGGIVHANAAGHAMLASGDFLRAAGGRLVASDPLADQTLRDAFNAAPGGDMLMGTKGIAVLLSSRDGERYVAHVLPLTSGARRQSGASYSAVAALFVHQAALKMPSPPEVIAKTFNLRPSELRVLLAVVEIGGVPETAAALGIGEGTVKAHLHRVFNKTGTSRQADLVKLVAGFASPLVG